MVRMMMKMAAVSTTTRLLLFYSMIAFTDSKGGCDSYAATDGDIIVPLHHSLDGSEQLKWIHNKSSIFHRRSPKVFISGNEKDVTKNGSLKLTNLKKQNGGEYTPEIFDTQGKSIPNLKSIRLCILDPIKKPTVTLRCRSTDVEFTCNVNSTASQDGQTNNLQIVWFRNDVSTQTKGSILKENAEKVAADFFKCKVSNPVSSLTSAAVQQNCFESSFFPEELFGINIWIIVGGGGGVVVMLIIIVIFCCIRARRKKTMQVKDEEELRLGWTNPDQPHHQHQHNHPPDQHHHHHHHHQQQPAGHTGPRQHRSKQHREQQREQHREQQREQHREQQREQHREQQRPRAPDHPNGHPQPSPRRPAQAPRPVDNADDEQPPPLPQPRKKAPKTPRV